MTHEATIADPGSTPGASTNMRGRNGFDGIGKCVTRGRAVDFPIGWQRTCQFGEQQKPIKAKNKVAVMPRRFASADLALAA